MRAAAPRSACSASTCSTRSMARKCCSSASSALLPQPAPQITKHVGHVLPGEARTLPSRARDRHPLGARRIVGATRHAGAPAREVVEVHRREVAEAAQVVAIPVEAEPLGAPDRETRFLAQLAARGLFDPLACFHEAAGN